MCLCVCPSVCPLRHQLASSLCVFVVCIFVDKFAPVCFVFIYVIVYTVFLSFAPVYCFCLLVSRPIVLFFICLRCLANFALYIYVFVIFTALIFLLTYAFAYNGRFVCSQLLLTVTLFFRSI